MPFQTIQFENISYSYDGVRDVLKNVSLSIERGKKYAFVGPSGSGKSTLLKILLGMESGYQGQIRVDGSVILPEDPKIQQYSVYISQSVYFFNDTVMNNICFGKKRI